MAAIRRYTEDQKEEILRTPLEGMSALSDRWGIPLKTLLSRKKNLRRLLGMAPSRGIDRRPWRSDPPLLARTPRGPNFARPDWFEEDLRAMIKGGVR